MHYHKRTGKIYTVPLGVFIFLGCNLVLVACSDNTPRPAPPPLASPLTLVDFNTTTLAQPKPCTGSFVAHTLDFTTVTNGKTIQMFESNGTGVAIGDLDSDGKPDLAFANLDGPDTIFWNQGDFQFRKDTLDDTNSRAVNIVDVDGDGQLDIVFTHRAGGVTFWQNTGGGSFKRQTLLGVLAPAYSMAWGDLNGDNALDLVTGTYDAELDKKLGNTALFNDDGGIYYYQHKGNGFGSQRLSRNAQALTIALPDLYSDGHPKILVGNDFALPDFAWQRATESWTAFTPFPTTTHSTMSFDTGDINNDGKIEFFATDMKPSDIDVPTVSSWLPLMSKMAKNHKSSDPQTMANVLQVRDDNGQFHDEAFGRGIDATGWSWAGKFGDLDNDGFLDLYVVNGMIAKELFHHLPNDELVEQNRAFHNDGTGHFQLMPGWGLGSTSSGRGMSMADLDGDGKLDIVVNNLRSPAQIFENRLCGGAGLEVELNWPTSQNSRGIGTRMVLHTSAGDYYRDVRVSSGYLSGDSPQLHFGFPAAATLYRLDIIWPDGAVSSVDTPSKQTLVSLMRK